MRSPAIKSDSSAAQFTLLVHCGQPLDDLLRLCLTLGRYGHTHQLPRAVAPILHPKLESKCTGVTFHHFCRAHDGY